MSVVCAFSARNCTLKHTSIWPLISCKSTDLYRKFTIQRLILLDLLFRLYCRIIITHIHSLWQHSVILNKNLLDNPSFLINFINNLVPSAFLDAKTKDFWPSKPSHSWSLQLRILLFLYITFSGLIKLIHNFWLKITANSFLPIVQVCRLISSDQETVHYKQLYVED